MTDVACCRRPTPPGLCLVSVLLVTLHITLIFASTLLFNRSLSAARPELPGLGSVGLANLPVSDQPVSDQPVSDQPESVLVRRDLSVRTPVIVRAIGPDGVLLDDGTHIPWFEVLVGQNWQLETPTGPQPLADREIQEWQRAFGQPWFLIRSRVARGESLQVDELLEELAQSYAARGTPSVGAVAVGYYRSQQHALAADPTAAALEWLRAQLAWSQLTLDPTPTQSLDWKPRLRQYIDPGDFPLDPLLGIPFHAPPAFGRWTAAEQSQWHALFEQAQTPPPPRQPTDTEPAVAGATAVGFLAHQHVKTLLAIYGLAAAAQHADPPTLEKCLSALEERHDVVGRPEQSVMQGLVAVARRVRRCQQEPARWQAAETSRDYLSLEQDWLGHQETRDGATRQRIVWEVYLQGLMLLAHEAPTAQESGRLHVWLLRHWAERYPGMAAEIPLLQASVWRPLLTR